MHLAFEDTLGFQGSSVHLPDPPSSSLDVFSGAALLSLPLKLIFTWTFRAHAVFGVGELYFGL